MSQPLDHKLAELKLGRMRQVYPTWIEQAAQTEMGYGEFLEQLVSEELLARQENHLRRKMVVLQKKWEGCYGREGSPLVQLRRLLQTGGRGR
jgi:hypothetical protein